MIGARTRKPLRRLVLLASSAALVTSGALVAPAQAATPRATTPRATTSSDWLVSQMNARDLVRTEYSNGDGTFSGYTDFGLSLDFFLAFEQLGVRAGKRAAILDAIEPRSEEYTDAFGTTYAGALGKLLTAVEIAGIDPSTYSTGDLVQRLEDLVVTAGPEEGRAKDNPDGDFESSNTFGQSFVATALVGADSPLADETLDFLLKQQCAAGYYREKMDSADGTCDGGTAAQRKSSLDATATAAVALRALSTVGPLEQRERARESFRDAIAWMVTRQADSGTFLAGRNTNSTGLAASAFIAAGRLNRAKLAARWIDDLRVNQRDIRTTAYRAGDLGAIAYDRTAFKRGESRGITRGDRYVWRRSTAQAAPALDQLS